MERFLLQLGSSEHAGTFEAMTQLGITANRVKDFYNLGLLSSNSGIGAMLGEIGRRDQIEGMLAMQMIIQHVNVSQGGQALKWVRLRPAGERPRRVRNDARRQAARLAV